MRGVRHREDAPHSNREDLANLRKLSVYLWDYRGRTALALACLILAKMATVGVPLILKEIINKLDHPTDIGESVLLGTLGLVAAYGMLRFAGSLFNELRDSLFARARYGAMHALSVKVLSHLHGLSLDYHLSRRTGSVTKDLNRGTGSLSSIVNTMVFNIVPTLAEFALVGFILLSNYRWQYTLVVIVTVVAYILFTIFCSGWRMQYRHRMNRLDSQASGRAVDSLLNYETVKYFNNENAEIESYRQQLADWADAGVKSQITMSLLNLGQVTLVTLGVTALMMLATIDVADGIITLGDIVMINAMMLQLFVPLNMLGFVYRNMQYSLADMDLVIRLLEQQSSVVDAEDAHPLRVDAGRVVFENVGFTYESQRPLLQGVSFTIEPGQKVAVVGPSGAGKSTLSRLLFRFYDVSEGSISIDGQDIRAVTAASLRQSIGIVPQDTVLFNESLAFNLRYARADATDEEIRQALEAASLAGFVDRLPEGLDTVVGERGLKLSGGEKQRMAIARVLLKQPPVVVFDEATSSLDSRSEQVILSAMENASSQATTLMIAHRLSTVVKADRILVLDGGRIVEQGTHRQLLSQGGVYASLWAMQQSGADNITGKEPRQ